MFRSTRDDTLVKTVEARYGIDPHARGDRFHGRSAFWVAREQRRQELI